MTGVQTCALPICDEAAALLMSAELCADSEPISPGVYICVEEEQLGRICREVLVEARSVCAAIVPNLDCLSMADRKSVV